jgi:ribonuclease-3
MLHNKKNLFSFSKRLKEEFNIELKDENLLKLALTHSSVRSSLLCNERLEFLGDAILGFIISEYLYSALPRHREGALTARKAALVSKPTLAKLAKEKLDLGKYLILGRGEERQDGRKKESILADALESLIGCIYLQHDINVVKNFIKVLFSEEFSKITKKFKRDYKSELQILTQRLFKTLPQYITVSEEGPDHAPRFYVNAYINGKLCGIGEGKSKREAEQMAATQAYHYIKRERF